MDGSLGTSLYGPQAVAGRRGLLAVALDATSQADKEAGAGTSPAFETGTDGQPRWVNGFSFAADSCDAVDPMAITCIDSPDDKPIPTNAGIVTIDPFLTFGAEQCSTIDASRDREARARRNLLTTESWQIEREFFDGVATKSATPDG